MSEADSPVERAERVETVPPAERAAPNPLVERAQRVETARPVVVGLGPVDPALVTPFLPSDAVFVRDPSPEDLAVAEGAIVRAAFDVDAALLDRMPRLRVAARTGVGVERVDLAAARARGVAVAITPGSNARAVAEGAFAMLLSLVKRVGVSDAYVSGDRWGVDPVPVPGDAFGKTLAVIGFGRIGRIIAGFGSAFGMRVIVHDPFVRSDEYENVSLEGAVREADALTLHLPGGDGELLPIELLRETRRGRGPLVLVNCARAELVSVETLRAALDEGALGGVGLDVFPSEPARAHPLAGRDDVLLSPHTTGLSEAAMAATFRMAAEAVAAVLAGGAPPHTV
ncbi:NAD(P)-dependent oxidoreductase [Leucobacter ruminantium]|uniref:NAD(P)-dependent oxidoreductase n=1 Tax=Leucobacter ruminantium TaxID=1289170 RepID=UPI0031333AEC